MPDDDKSAESLSRSRWWQRSNRTAKYPPCLTDSKLWNTCLSVEALLRELERVRDLASTRLCDTRCASTGQVSFYLNEHVDTSPVDAS